jgi:hypothetical protein
MLPSRYAVLTRDGKGVTSGRASYVWLTYLENVASGVPGTYRIKRAERGAPWHRLDLSVEQAEQELLSGRLGAAARVARCRRRRERKVSVGDPTD